MEPHRPLDLGLEVAQIGDRRRGHVRDLVRQRDQRGALSLPPRRAGMVAHGRRRGGPGVGRRGRRPLHPRVHVALVVVADVEHVIAALEHPREAGETDVNRAPVATLANHPRVSVSLRLERGGDSARHRRGVAEQRVNPGKLPRRLGVGGGEDLEAPGGVGGDHVAARGAERGVEGEARPESLAAPLTRAVAAGDGVRAAAIGLHRALLGVKQAVAVHEAAGLVVLDALVGHARHTARAPTTPRSRRMFSAWGPDRRRWASRASSRSIRPRSRSMNVVSPSSPASAAETSLRRDDLVIGRPPSPAITVWTAHPEPSTALWTFCETIPPIPIDSAFSSTITRRALDSAARISSRGQGRKVLIPTHPILIPSSRRSSTTSSIVPSTEPSATTIVSASWLR